MNPNKIRVINTKMVHYNEGKKRSKTIFGFMAINGNDVAMVSDTAKKGNMEVFLNLVRKENGKTPIIAIMDNLPVHKAKIVKKDCEELNIYQVFLPPYSPDLNPIEFGWKDTKRELSMVLNFDETVKQCKEITLRMFHDKKERYTSHWLRSFIPVRS